MKTVSNRVGPRLVMTHATVEATSPFLPSEGGCLKRSDACYGRGSTFRLKYNSF